VNFDLIDTQLLFGNFFNFEQEYELISLIEEKKEETVLSRPLMEIEYETFNPILNIGGILITFIVYFAQIVVYFIIK
jgi:hypothetical protein